MKVGDRVKVKPSAFGRDGWRGDGEVVELSSTGEVAVQLAADVVWFHPQRIMTEADFYAAVVAAGIEVDHHESDLYVLDTPEARELVRTYDKPLQVFTSHVDGRQWLDVPFAYTPYWEKRR